jgi:hypothetical protein
VHARKITSAVGLDLGLDERYQAAAGVYARLGAVVSNTYALIAYLFREGLMIETRRVVVHRSRRRRDKH